MSRKRKPSSKSGADVVQAREGTLQNTTVNPSKKESYEEFMARAQRAQPDAILGLSDSQFLADFLAKATSLADEMAQRGEISAQSARRLRFAMEWISDALEAGYDRAVLKQAVIAGIIFAKLGDAKRADDTVRPRGKSKAAPITPTRYWDACKAVKADGKRITDARVAEKLEKTTEGVAKWRKKHFGG